MELKISSWGKKGYIYFVEIALAILILMYIFNGFVESEQRVFEQKQIENLRSQGWGALDVLHELDVLDGAVKSGNWNKMNIYLRKSLLNTVAFDLELYNNSKCHAIDNTTVVVGATYCKSINATTENEISSTYYTIQDNYSTSSVKIYLWNKL